MTYDYLQFRFTRVGEEEIEIVSEDTEVCALHIVTSIRDGSISFAEKRFGFSARAADKYVRALGVLRKSGRIEIYDLRHSRTIFSPTLAGDFPSSMATLERYAEFFRKAVKICDRFRVEIRLTRAVTQADAEVFELLDGMVSGAIPRGSVNFSIFKNSRISPGIGTVARWI